MTFRDRTHAGIELAEKLKRYAGSSAVILAIPRGGVPVACEVARETELPLQLFYMKKIGHPRDREYAIGVVGLDDIVLIPNAGIGHRYIDLEAAQVRKRLAGMEARFGMNDIGLTGRMVIIVDDGLATDTTLVCAIRMLRKKSPRAIVVATPVASRSAAFRVSGDADDFVSVQIIEDFRGVGNYYRDFHQLDDDEMMAELQLCKCAAVPA